MMKFIEKLRALPESKKMIIFFGVVGISALLAGFIGMRFILADFAKINDLGKNVNLPQIDLPKIDFPDIDMGNVSESNQGVIKQ